MFRSLRFSLLLTFLLPGLAPAQSLTKKMDQFVRPYVEGHLFQGNVLIAQRGKVVFQHAYGMADFDWKIPVTETTKFRIGSLTKQFTATLVLLLREQGKIQLDAPIRRYLPWYPKPLGDQITVHHLLSHTSGLFNYTTIEAVNDLSLHAYAMDSVAKRYCTGPLNFPPGTKFEYCNSGYYLLGVILQAVSGKPYAQLLQELILRPVGMTHSGMDTAMRLLPNRATGYGYGFDGYEKAEYLDPALCFASAGGMYSTIGDLLAWQTALHGGRVLADSSRQLMITPRLGHYGYGVYVVQTKDSATQQPRTLIGHNGGLAGFSSTMLCYAEEGIVALLLDNTRAATRANPEAILAGLVDLVRGKTPKPYVASMQVALIEQLPHLSGAELVAFYQSAPKPHYDASANEGFWNNLGNHLLQEGRVPDALSILAFATTAYPTSAVCFDSYAEALEKAGQREAAIQMYRRSLELDPQNPHAVQQLRALEAGIR